MKLTKRELTQSLLNGEKLRPKNYDINCYCCYDETYTKPFRIIEDNLCNTAMNESWNETEWKTYKEIPVFWEPKENEKAYFIKISGKIATSRIWDYENDKAVIKQGNVFRTEEEAEKEVKLRAAKYRVKKRVYELNGGEFIKFKRNGPNWSFGLDKETLEVSNFYRIKTYPSWQYLKSKEAVEQLIDEMSEDLLFIRSE